MRKEERARAVGEDGREVSGYPCVGISLLGLHMLRLGSGRSGVLVQMPAMLDTECWVIDTLWRRR